MFKDWFEHGIISHTQVLDLYLTMLGPLLGYLRGVWWGRQTQDSESHSDFNSPLQTTPENTATENRPLATSHLSMLQWSLV